MSRSSRVGLNRSASTSTAQSSVSDGEKRGFRRSMSNLGETLKGLSTSSSKRRSMQLEQQLAVAYPTSPTSTSSTAAESAQSSKRERRSSLNRFGSLKGWGTGTTSTTPADSQQESSLPRSSSSLSSYRQSFTVGLRNIKEKAAEFGTVPEIEPVEIAPAPPPKARPRRAGTVEKFDPRRGWYTVDTGEGPSQASTSDAVAFAMSETTSFDVLPTPKINVSAPAVVRAVAPPAPKATASDAMVAPSMAPRLSFGGDQIVDDDWGELTQKPEPSSSESHLAVGINGLDEKRGSTGGSSIGEITQATQAVPAQAQLVDARTAGVQETSDLHPFPTSGGIEKSLPAPPLRLNSHKGSISSLEKRSPIKRLISSDSWKKLSLSASDMLSTGSKTSENATEQPESASIYSEPSLDEEAAAARSQGINEEEPAAAPLSRSGTQASLSDSKFSESGHFLTNRLTTPNHRSSFGEARGSFDAVGAVPFTRRDGNARDSLHRLSMGNVSSPGASPHSTRSSPIADRMVSA